MKIRKWYRSKEDVSHQEELNGPQDVHGSSEGCPQVETDPHCSPELRAQGAGYHVVGASSYTQTQTMLTEICVNVQLYESLKVFFITSPRKF